jgi:hypothetical protein
MRLFESAGIEAKLHNHKKRRTRKQNRMAVLCFMWLTSAIAVRGQKGRPKRGQGPNGVGLRLIASVFEKRQKFLIKVKAEMSWFGSVDFVAIKMEGGAGEEGAA